MVNKVKELLRKSIYYEADLSATIFRMATEGSPADKAMAERYADAPEVDAHRLWRLIVMAFDDLYRCVLDHSKTNEFSNYYRILSQ